MTNEAFVRENSIYLTIKPFTELNDRLIVGFSTRQKGFSIKPYDSLNMGLHVKDNENDVVANRKMLADKIDVPLENWVFTEQVHGGQIKKVGKEDCGSGTDCFSSSIKGCDGLYTSDKNVLLASLYADCVPLYFYSTQKQLIGLAHAGWKGTVALIGPEMVRLWVERENVALESIYACVGPAISHKNYEVDEFVINKVRQVIPNKKILPYTKVDGSDKYLLDLKLLNKQLLIEAGIKPNNIFFSNYCTFEEEELFYSYRRDQTTGRMMSFISQ